MFANRKNDPDKHDTKLDFLLVEAEEVRKAKESLRAILFGVFAAYLPALLSIFGFAVSHKDTASALVEQRTIATVFVLVTCLSAIWIQYLWMEYISCMRYYYLELLPRIYDATDQPPRRNFLAWTIPRSARQLFPLALFNIGSFVVMFGAYWTYVRGGPNYAVDCLCIGFLGATVASVGCVLLEVRALGEEISRSIALGSSEAQKRKP